MSKAVAQKIKQVMEKVKYLQKDGKVEYGRTNYNYLSEEKVTTELNQAFREIGLVIYPVEMEFLGTEEVSTKSGTSYVKKIKGTYHIQDIETGEYIKVQALGEGMDSGDKALNKAMTGCFKYIQRQSFMIPTGDDPDHTSSDELIGEKETQQIYKNFEEAEKSYICSDCGQPMSQAEDAYSRHHYGQPLCRDCQKKHQKVS